MCSNTLLNSLDSRHPLAFSSSSFSTLSFHHITRLLLLCLEREEHDIKHTEKSRCRLLLFALQLAAIVHPTQACACCIKIHLPSAYELKKFLCRIAPFALPSDSSVERRNLVRYSLCARSYSAWLTLA